MPKLTQTLPPGPLAIIGDIHGEIGALERLLDRLSAYDGQQAKRTLVFVGDLVDRGPDSVAVIECVSRLVEGGDAVAILGNHELNILRGETKDGNGWYFGEEQITQVENKGPVPYVSRLASDADRQLVLRFLRSLPLVLERDDLRVVHACWNDESMKRLPDCGDVAQLMQSIGVDIRNDLDRRGVLVTAEKEESEFAELKDINQKPKRFLENVATREFELQAYNPIKVLTSGLEAKVKPDGVFFAGGKWRFLARDNWWERGVDRPTIVGHYWRNREVTKQGHEPWDKEPPFAWSGNVYCVDYSVGYRYRERAAGVTTDFRCGLGALLWPERKVLFDDREEPNTTSFG